MVTRRWTLNSNLDYYVATNQTDPDVLLHLCYKAPSGAVEDVGEYKLDLDALTDKGVVTRRETPGGIVYDVKIVHRRDRYALQVRKGRSIPLDRFVTSR